MDQHPLPPYHVNIPLAELEAAIHGGGPKTLECDLVFTPNEDFPATPRHDPAKLVLHIAKMHTVLKLGVTGVVEKPEVMAERAERDARLAARLHLQDPAPDAAAPVEVVRQEVPAAPSDPSEPVVTVDDADRGDDVYVPGPR